MPFWGWQWARTGKREAGQPKAQGLAGGGTRFRSVIVIGGHPPRVSRCGMDLLQSTSSVGVSQARNPALLWTHLTRFFSRAHTFFFKFSIYLSPVWVSGFMIMNRARADGGRESGGTVVQGHVNITHILIITCHTHHTITEKSRRVAVNRGARSGHLGSVARQPSRPNLPGSLLAAEDAADDGRLVVVVGGGPLLLDGGRRLLREDAVLDRVCVGA